ncbi:MAG: type II toxin-antitoxin system VapC family toxin [Propionicimonas sp.]|uniref:type II toxin-antitoxin system VapC family toxin n=1 Tax=Propionicimonas sp. TaxID=1955623 RepID=UPI003D0E19DA
MIVDTSAIVALMLGESKAADIARVLADGPARMSAATLVELHAMAANRLSTVQQRRLERLLTEAEVEIVPFTEDQARVAGQALRDFGRGSGHPAQLNLGDAYSYALAATTGEPLLFVGDDFGHTDLIPAL